MSKVQLLKLFFHRLALAIGFDQLLLNYVIMRSDNPIIPGMNSARSSATNVCVRVCARDLELGFFEVEHGLKAHQFLLVQIFLVSAQCKIHTSVCVVSHLVFV